MGRKPIPYEYNHKEINGILYKKCNKHEKLLPLEDPWLPCTEEYFQLNDKNKQDGLSYHCRTCNNLIRRPNSKRRKSIYKKQPLSNVSKRLRRIYINMVQRCYNSNNTTYKYYGNRGIIVCNEWLNDRYKFFQWALDNGYEENLTIDRKDVDGNYEPSNCRWATMKEQANNKTSNHFLEIDGETKTITQWSEENNLSPSTFVKRFSTSPDNIYQNQRYSIFVEINGEIKNLKQLANESGLPYYLLLQRYKAGWNVDHLLDDLVNKTKQVEINGEVHTIREWAEMYGLSKQLIVNRMRRGWEGEDLIKPV